MLTVQSIFDNLDAEEMRKARTKSNPFETIRGVFFLNRYYHRRLHLLDVYNNNIIIIIFISIEDLCCLIADYKVVLLCDFSFCNPM